MPHSFTPAPSHTPLAHHAGRHPQGHAQRCAQYQQKCQQDQRFVELLQAYRASGGLARAQEVRTLHLRTSTPERRALARRIAGRELISFEWQAQTWLPLFQFARTDMGLLPGMAPVLAELVPVLDGWEMAEWFVRATPALHDASPLQLLPQGLPEVLDAARLDRFILGV
jgi:hypothetical protein